MTRIADLIKDLQKILDEKGNITVAVAVDKNGDGTFYNYEGTITCDVSLNEGDPIEDEYYVNLIVD